MRNAESPHRFSIPVDLVPLLRDLQASQQPYGIDEIDREDVVRLYDGLGLAMFLAFDGRMIVHSECDGTGVYEVSDLKEACIGLALGAAGLRAPELRSLLPERPVGATDYPDCKGTGWYAFPQCDGRQGKVVCWTCGAMGWRP
jgi:hypothetical protein